jgi:DNA primase
MDYYWHEGIFKRKLYFPQTKGKYRFLSNVDSTIVQGWTLLPKYESDILFITKSYKDILTFNLLGFWAIAPNSEHAFIPEQVMEKLKKRFRNIYVWFDNDESGIKGGDQFANKFQLPFTYNPIGQPKDPSDYVKEYNLKAFDKLVLSYLKDEGY